MAKPWGYQASKTSQPGLKGLAQEDSDAKPAYFLGAAGPLPSPSLVETAISSLPPDAEVPQHPVSLAQSSQDDTEVRHTGVSVKRKRKQGKYLSDLLTRPQRFFYFEPIRQKWDPGDWHLTLAREWWQAGPLWRLTKEAVAKQKEVAARVGCKRVLSLQPRVLFCFVFFCAYEGPRNQQHQPPSCIVSTAWCGGNPRQVCHLTPPSWTVSPKIFGSTKQHVPFPQSTQPGHTPDLRFKRLIQGH